MRPIFRPTNADKRFLTRSESDTEHFPGHGLDIALDDDWSSFRLTANQTYALTTSALDERGPAPGIAFDGVIVEHGSALLSDTTDIAVRPGSPETPFNDSMQTGIPFDGSADANGRFDIVIRYTGDPTYASYFEAARLRWEQIITNDLPDSSYNGTFVDDLLIDASVVLIDGAGDGTRNVLGSAGPDWIRTASQLPIHGNMRFDSYDIAQMANSGILDEVILHEMGHVLGIGTLWTNLGLRTGDASYYGFIGSNALAEYRALSGNTSATSVPVHPGTIAGSSGSHWAESVFQNELMTPSTGPGTYMPISRLTIASLADLGYAVNLASADAYAFPGGGNAGSVSINDVIITEGNSGTQLAILTVSRTGGTAAFSINFATANGTAVADSDYVAKSGTLNFGLGVNSQTITVSIIGDTTAEPSETLFVNLLGATNGAAVTDGQGQVVISNDDFGPGSISINDVIITEGNSGTQLATFSVIRTGGSAPFAINYATANGTASAGSDYVAATGTLNFGSGVNSQTLSVTINGDFTVETSETFFVNLSGATNGASVSDSQGQGTIANDDSGPGSISINDVIITEGHGGTALATFTVIRTGGIAPFAVGFATANGTATAGSDYVATSGTLNFGAGINSQTFSVTVNGDTTIENSESFFVNLSGATNGASIADGQGQGTIANDDDSGPLPDDFADDLADTTAPFGRISVGGSATGDLELAGDSDWFRVSLTAGALLTIDLQGVPTNSGTLSDPYLYLYNSAGQLLDEDDDSGSGVNSQLAFTPGTSGIYYLAARAYTDNFPGTYTIRVSQASDDYADSFSDATAPFGQPGIGPAVTGNLEVVGDRDWYSITLTAGVSFTIDLRGSATAAGTLADPYLYLYDAAGQILDENDDSVGLDSQLIFTPTFSGTYYIAAAGYDDSASGTYSLAITAPDDFADTLTDTTVPFGQINPGGLATANLEVLGDQDWFRITLTGGVNYTVNLEGSPTSAGTLLDPYLSLYNSAGQLLVEDDDSGSGVNSQLTYTPSVSGTYYLGAAAYDDSYAGTYQISVSAPAPINGTDGDNQLPGTPGSDIINGLGGNDILFGDAGNDTLNGGTGGDFLDGGPGGDALDGGADFDLASWLSETTGLTLNLANQALNAGSAAGDTVANIEALYLTNSADNFTMGSIGLFVYGFGGSDTITGSAQSDFIDGGPGADTINAGGGFDYVSYNSSTAAVTLNLQTPASNTGHAAGDAISNADAYILTEFGDTFIGLTNGQNIVFGYGGNDTLTGGFNANNWLFGGSGNDRMVGGGIADLFVGDSGADTIVPVTRTPIAGSSVFGFTPGTDAIEISRSAFGLSAGYAVSAGTTFAAGTAPGNTVASPTFIYYTNSGLLYFDPDGTGATAATLLMQLAGAPALGASDFHLV